MPRVFITHRVRDRDHWSRVASNLPVDLMGAESVVQYVCTDDPSKTGVMIEYADRTDGRLLMSAIAEMPGLDEFLEQLGVVRETVEVYVETSPAGPAE